MKGDNSHYYGARPYTRALRQVFFVINGMQPGTDNSKRARVFAILTGIWAKAVIVVLSAALAAWLPWYWFGNRPVPFAAGSVTVSVPPGASGRTVAELTRAAGVGVSVPVLVGAMRVRDDAGSLHAGRYRLSRGMTLRDIVDHFHSGCVERASLRLAEGLTVRELRAAVESCADLSITTRGIPDGELARMIGVGRESLEGMLAPETYVFTSGVPDVQVYRMALERQKRLLLSEWEGRAEGLKLASPYEALILASIIEKETGRAEDRALVSSVFHNRLKKGMPLQTDPTVIYGMGGSFNGVIRKSDLRRPGPFNTYVNLGLPPTPIAAPSPASIHAALHPAETRFLYFVARGDGTTEFSERLSRHNSAVQRYQRGQRK